MTVKWYSSAMPSAPQLTGQAGSMIALLDACLLNGFGARAIDSISVVDGLATATISAGHTFPLWALVSVVNSPNPALSGLRRVVSATGQTFSFPAVGVGNGSVGAGASVSLPPLGSWGKAFSDTNLAAYRSASPAGTGRFLRVDDGGTNWARVRAYEDMTDASTGTDPFPTASQDADPGARWGKSATADAVARAWWLVGDETAFHLFVQANPGISIYTAWYCFGDALAPWKAGDAYAAILSAGRAGIAGVPYPYHCPYAGATHTNGTVTICRRHTGVAGALQPDYWGVKADFASACSPGTGPFAYPHPVDGRLWAGPVHISDALSVPRGVLRGIIQPLHTVGAANAAYPNPATPIDYLDVSPMVLAGFGPRGYAGTQLDLMVDLSGDLW